MKKRHIGMVLLLVIPLIVIEIWAVNRLSTYGEQISKLEETRAALEIENKILENKIAKETSLLNMVSLSSQLGFEVALNVEYLNTP